ncbi:anti-virulence regulator CigR family protein [Pantoea eucrina]|uniref:RcnB family protein n=1 Tax=Pantoea eucrina TaxID=472693 RepID=A0ABU5LJZ8_9GAMM|nr:anti-virulence regulator CigR family protein [Pantoea eucrina]MDZ7280061.1 RcnB family protein [Pantoea eucrina]
MSLPHTFVTALLAGVLCTTPALANPGNGNGNHGNHGHSAGKGHGKPQRDDDPRPGYDDASGIRVDLDYSRARALAVNHGAVGYRALPPGIAKNLARGKPLPPGIAKKALPAGMLRDLPRYPGYEWRAVGDDLVLIALSTAIVTAVINGVFD